MGELTDKLVGKLVEVLDVDVVLEELSEQPINVLLNNMMADKQNNIFIFTSGMGVLLVVKKNGTNSYYP